MELGNVPDSIFSIMNDEIVVCVKSGGDRDWAMSLADNIEADVTNNPGEKLTILFDESGVSLLGYGLSYQGDFTGMLRRVSGGRLLHEMLVKAVKTSEIGLKAVDATAGMGEDAFLIAAYGYEVTMYEQNPVIATLLKDAIRRGRKNPEIKDIVGRMNLIVGDSVKLLNESMDSPDVIYLDPMFPARQKSGLINKKLQLIQKLEPPCSAESELFAAAIKSGAGKIVVKRPLKAPNLDGRKPNYVLNGKAIRYDCYIF